MSDAGNDGPPAPDEVSAPFIFVPHGAPLPTEWLARHPGAIRIPAIFVPHRPPPPIGRMHRMRHESRDAFPLIGGSATLEDPVAAFRRINAMLNRMG